MFTSAAVLVATTAGLFAGNIAPAQAQGGNYYGAIAANVRAGVYGYAQDYDSYSAARSAAINACAGAGGGGGCAVKVSYRNGCGAISISKGWWGFGSASTLQGAKREALNANPGAGAFIKHWNCTSNYSL
ncbi:DUF4189 domain-containing protein [Nocardia camponoti]|nr:DUF4189 domain-containing protein [Nocardia camponoti]